MSLFSLTHSINSEYRGGGRLSKYNPIRKEDIIEFNHLSRKEVSYGTISR